MPFDGAGICTPQCAARWSLELNIRNRKKKRYIPAAYQFRAIPGIKGELFVTDFYEFAREHNHWIIKDIWGKYWDLRKTKIDCILTKSQFKFCDLYKSYSQWREEFERELYGYKRTFNISSYSEDVCDLKRETLISYQPLQTLFFTQEEIENVTARGYEIYWNISKDIDGFIKYRGIIIGEEDETGQIIVNESVSSYFQALLYDKTLCNDPYIKSKIADDIQRFKNNLLAGKCIVDGNYQTLTIDVYAFMEYIFRLPVNGLLRRGQVYSNYWNTENKKINEIDITRAPHIAMEHRIGYLRSSDKMSKWYKYQTTGIITSIHDTYLLAIGGADADGDHVCTTSNATIINAAKRELEAGHGRTIYFNKLNFEKDRSCYINDTSALMEVNLDSFKNSIGRVINDISKLWSMKLTDNIRDAIKICSCIGALVIDFAKTGETAEIPEEIKKLYRFVNKPHFMRYLSKNLKKSAQEINAISKARSLGKSEDYIDAIRSFEKSQSNMNRICFHAEHELAAFDCTVFPEDKEFNYKNLLMDKSDFPINRKVRNILVERQGIYEDIGIEFSMEKSIGLEVQKDYMARYRALYSNTRWELLCAYPDINRLLDTVIKLYYTDKRLLRKSKDILWNAFGGELVKRCKGDFSTDSPDIYKIKGQKIRSEKILKKQVIEKQKVKKGTIKSLERDDVAENKIRISFDDRKWINETVDNMTDIKELHKTDLKRFMATLLMISEKLGIDYVPKYYNAPNDITDLSLSKIAGIDRRKVKDFPLYLEKHGLVENNVDKKAVMEIYLHFDTVKSNNGEMWIDDTNYSRAGSKIRDYFRK